MRRQHSSSRLTASLAILFVFVFFLASLSFTNAVETGKKQKAFGVPASHKSLAKSMSAGKSAASSTSSKAHAPTPSGKNGTHHSPKPAGDAASSSLPFWIGQIQHNGTAAYNPSPATYKVYRNVKDYGAKGDGTTDDTAAINAAISDGNGCGQGCDSSTVSPALVFFPAGSYLLSSPIISYYYTQLVGDYNSRPTLITAPSFTGIAAIDEDPYLPGGANWYTNQNNFYREVRNFVIDLTQQPTTTGTGVHHQVSQATGLYNVKFVMRTESNTAQQGIFMENGSGGVLRDLEFVGGKFGAFFGNQQFTVTNLTFSGCQEAIHAIWDWGWTYHNVKVDNCGVALTMDTGSSPTAQAVASEMIVDWEISNTPVAFDLVGPSDNSTLVLENIKVTNVSTIVRDNGQVLLKGSSGSQTVASWVQGYAYQGSSGSRIHGPLPYTTSRDSSLLDSDGKWFTRSRPQYGDQAASAFVNVKAYGAKGDGTTDDTTALQTVLNRFASSNIIYIPQGTYIVTSTLKIPIGTRMVGEVWSVLMGSGSAFQDASNPVAVFKVGNPGDAGVLELTDLIFTIRGPAPGAVIMEWNVRDAAGQKGTVGIWDCHIRVGGFAGTNLEGDKCPSQVDTVNDQCRAAFLGMHVTKQASLFASNIWIWVADHDLDYGSKGQINIYNGRGWLVEAEEGPVWMYGTSSEHSQLYQYSFQNSKNCLVALPQTETPYMQGTGFPPATTVEPPNSAYNDPTFNNCNPATDTSCNKAWSTVVSNSSNIYFYGMGAYSFFDNYSQDCLNNSTCQRNIVEFTTPGDNNYVYNLNTVGTSVMVVKDGKDMVPAAPLRRGFTSTLAAWRP